MTEQRTIYPLTTVKEYDTPNHESNHESNNELNWLRYKVLTEENWLWNYDLQLRLRFASGPQLRLQLQLRNYTGDVGCGSFILCVVVSLARGRAFRSLLPWLRPHAGLREFKKKKKKKLRKATRHFSPVFKVCWRIGKWKRKWRSMWYRETWKKSQNSIYYHWEKSMKVLYKRVYLSFKLLLYWFSAFRWISL